MKRSVKYIITFVSRQKFGTLPARRALQLGEANPSFRLRQGYDVTCLRKTTAWQASWRIRIRDQKAGVTD